jgi:CubicO group peptidase (beta-lactamase class C family)
METLRDQLEQLATAAIRARWFPGVSIAIVVDDYVVYCSFGRTTYDSSAAPVCENTIYDVASLTKAIVTAPLICSALATGEIQADDKLTRYLPDYRGAGRDSIHISHLLTHTVEFDYRLSSFRELDSVDIRKTILSGGLKGTPGLRFVYSNANYILLGWILEAIYGNTLEALATDRIFRPLSLVHTSLRMPLSAEGVAPSEYDPWRGREIRGEIHDEVAWKLSHIGSVGSAGIFSTSSDLACYMRMLLKGGNYQGKPVLTSEAVRQMLEPRLEPPLCRYSFGWALSEGDWAGSSPRPEAFGKTGFTGCSMMADASLRVAVVIMANNTFPSRNSAEWRKATAGSFRRSVVDAVYRCREAGLTDATQH